MPYAFVQDVPADEHIYAQVRAKLGTEAPQGLVAHIVMKRPEGLRYVDVWETRADWERFRDEQVDPAVRQVLGSLGIPFDRSQVKFEEVEAIDTWLGQPSLV